MPLSESCSACGCDIIVRESTQVSRYGKKPASIDEHVHGGRWDERVFLCGQTVRWECNFGMEKSLAQCHNSPEYIARQEQIKKLDDEIKELQEQRRKLW